MSEVMEGEGAYYSGSNRWIDLSPEFIFLPNLNNVTITVHGFTEGKYQLFVLKENNGSVTFYGSSGEVSISPQEEQSWEITNVGLARENQFTFWLTRGILGGVIAVAATILVKVRTRFSKRKC